MHSAEQREKYETPKLGSHGSISALTKGLSTGSFLDANFLRGTPVEDLTFS